MTTRDGRQISQADASVADLVDAGVCFAGTPDQVVSQIRRFNDYVGGCGNLLVMLQGGTLTHAETVKNLNLFSREVLPRIQDLVPAPSPEMEEIARLRESMRNGLAAAQ